MKLVDAHHHFWDLSRNYHPWLCDDPQIPFRYGNYQAIRRNYLPQDYARDACGYDIAASVYVEAEWDPEDPVGEVRWVDEVSTKCAHPVLIVAQAHLDHADVGEILAQHATFDSVRGVRHKPRATPRDARVKRGLVGSPDSRGLNLMDSLLTFKCRFGISTRPVNWPLTFRVPRLFSTIPAYRRIVARTD